MAAPYEIIGAPFTIYVAPVGETVPAISAAVAGNWMMLGTSGTKNYSDDGVKVTSDQNIEVFRGAGSTGPRKAFRTEEDLMIGFGLVDLSPDQYAKVLNNAAVTTIAQTSGVAGQKYFNLLQGLEVRTLALLARGPSSIDDSLNAQYEVPIVYQSESPEPVTNKGEPSILDCEFSAIEHVSLGFGKFRVQSTVPGA